jgi:hypothetical protein
MANRGGPWLTVDSFDTVTAAARKIIELEAYPVSGVFFEILIETKDGNKEEAFSHLKYTGKHGRRYVHNCPIKSWLLHATVSIPLGILRFFGAALAPIVQNAAMRRLRATSVLTGRDLDLA